MEIMLGLFATLVPFVVIVAAGLYVEARWIGLPQHQTKSPTS